MTRSLPWRARSIARWPVLAMGAAWVLQSIAAPRFVPAQHAPRVAPQGKQSNEESPFLRAETLGLAALMTPLAAHAEDGGDSGDWFEPFVDFNANIIEGIDGLVGSAGFAIVLYTMIIKVATFPLQQPALRTSALMQLLSPQTDEIERKYPLDEEGRGRTLRELYGKVGLNPFAAFLPILFQLPIFIALFRAIGKLASQDEHFKEPSRNRKFLVIFHPFSPNGPWTSIDRINEMTGSSEYLALLHFDA